MSGRASRSERNRGVVRTALFVCAGAFAFGFAMVPIYRIACERVFGIKLAEAAASRDATAAFVEDASRTIRVQFLANVNSRLPWTFHPETAAIDVHPGQAAEAWFVAANTSDQAIVGNAVPSIVPNDASRYFAKTECFCFTEQKLAAGESRRMPVRFVVDPKLPDDVTELTLSYTFYENPAATARLADPAGALPAG